MKRLLTVIFLLLWSQSVTSQTQITRIRQFKGNDSRTSDRLVEPNYSRVAHNVDFSRVLGEISKRKGFAFVDSLPDDFDYDSLIALYPVYLSDGRQSLLFGADVLGGWTGYGHLYTTGFGKADIDTAVPAWGGYNYLVNQVYTYWSPQASTYFTTFNDLVYASNGLHKGAVIDVNLEHSASWPLNAPGEPKIIPIACSTNTSYKFAGEYRYAMRMIGFDGGLVVTRTTGTISAPVRVNGRVLITDFSMLPNDTFFTSMDSVKGQIYRTRANPGRLDELDTLYRVGNGDTVTIKAAITLGGLKFIDSLPDTLLSTTDKFAMHQAQTRVGKDSAYFAGANHRYGAPSYIRDSNVTWALADSSKRFIWGGSMGSHSAADTTAWPIAYAYTTTFYDTLLKVESDTGRSIFIYEDTTRKKIVNVRLGIPPVPFELTHTVRRLYRAMLMYSGRDTAMAVYSYCDNSRDQIENDWVVVSQQIHDPYYLSEIRSVGSGWCFDKMLKTTTRDTIIVTPYIMVAEIPAESLAYTDSTRFDSLVQHQWYQRKVPPPFLTSIFGYGNYIFGIQGSRLYQSQQDTAGFGAFSFVSVNEDDGDVGTLARPSRRAIRYYKNNSSWNVFQDADGVYREYEFVNGIGCIAPQSGIQTPYGFIYLSNAGVVLENDGDYLERTVKSGIISSRLDNFDKMSVAVKSKAKGVYVDNKYLLYIPAPIDTCYVYDILADAWATWDFDISGAALYGTETTVNHLPGDTLFFYQPNSRSLFKFGTGETDAGDTITATWLSVPLLADGYINQLQKIGTWTLCDSSIALGGTVRKESGVISPSVVYTDDMSEYVQVREFQAGFYGKYVQIGISCSSVYEFSVGGFDLHWRRYEEILDGAAH